MARLILPNNVYYRLTPSNTHIHVSNNTSAAISQHGSNLFSLPITSAIVPRGIDAAIESRRLPPKASANTRIGGVKGGAHASDYASANPLSLAVIDEHSSDVGRTDRQHIAPDDDCSTNITNVDVNVKVR